MAEEEEGFFTKTNKEISAEQSYSPISPFAVKSSGVYGLGREPEDVCSCIFSGDLCLLFQGESV